MRNKMLEDALYEYIKEHQSDNIDIVSLVIAFPKYNADILLSTINTLRVDKKIDRINIGIYYKYVIL